jgi:hypothetical protein
VPKPIETAKESILSATASIVTSIMLVFVINYYPENNDQKEYYKRLLLAQSGRL